MRVPRADASSGSLAFDAGGGPPLQPPPRVFAKSAMRVVCWKWHDSSASKPSLLKICTESPTHPECAVAGCDADNGVSSRLLRLGNDAQVWPGGFPSARILLFGLFV